MQMEGHLAIAFILSLLAGSLSQCPPSLISPPGDTNNPNGTCNCRTQGSGYFVGCNRRSINVVVEVIRQAGSFIRNVGTLSFTNPPETFVAANTFMNFTGLNSLTICCSSSLTYIENNAFVSLSHLRRLDLHGNHLQWLSGSSFAGLGTLTILDLESNALRNLREDLQEFFRGVTTLILSSNTFLVCDCHLSWLPTYISSRRSVHYSDLNCSVPVQRAITDPSINFTFSCIGLCSLGYYSCSPNAMCSVDIHNETVCSCRLGYTGDGQTCEPVANPCDTILPLCSKNAMCTPNYTAQTRECECRSGFTGDGTSCTLIDPCSTLTCSPNAACILSNQIPVCICNAGYTGDGENCVLTDPCSTVRCSANATCSFDNPEREARCICNADFTGDGETCVLIDPCSSRTCHDNATCVCSSDGRTAVCVCDARFTGDGENCILIDLCSAVICHVNATCLQNNGSCACNAGYTGDGENCVLTDPCSTVRCSANATCSFVNPEREARCVCNADFTGDGETCVPIDPCSSQTCHDNATCVRSIDGRTAMCVCDTRFTGDGENCILIDLCSAVTCHVNATCLQNNGSCVCNAGFTGDGENCNLMNPCSVIPCHPNATCYLDERTQRGLCVCNNGFSGNGVNCSLIVDPCSSMLCHVNATCSLDKQFVRCVCNSRFTGDGVSCSLIDPCSVVTCHANATCTPDGMCVCNVGFTGDGMDCDIDLCYNQSCHQNASCAADGMCTCNSGFTGNGTECAAEEVCGRECPGVSCVLREGRPMCVAMNIQDLQALLSAVLADPTIDPGLTSFTDQLNSTASNLTQAEDIPLIINLLIQSLSISADLSMDSYMNLVHAGSELLDPDAHSLWFQLNQSEVVGLAARLLMSLEIIGQQIFLQTNMSQRTAITSENIAIVVVRPGCGNTDNITVSSSELDATPPGGGVDSSITLPPSIFGMGGDCMETGLIVVVTDGIGPLLSVNDILPSCDPPTLLVAHGRCEWYPLEPDLCSNRTVDGSVVSATAVSAVNDSNVSRLNTSVLLEPVRITFRHRMPGMLTPTCAFLDEQRVQLAEEAWLTERCRVVVEESSSEHTVCECYHLTSFALLTSPTGSVTEKRPLQIVSKIGLSISIICLIITIILLFVLKLETKQLHRVHRQLAIALCLAQTLFLVGVDRTIVPSPDAVCTTIAVLLHYFFLSTFAWQLVEGIHLYVFVVKVFYNKKVVWLYYPFAWGLPAVVVIITLGIKFCNYGSEHYCWITEGGGANWAFHGPVLAVLAINIVIMMVITFIIVRAARKKENPDTCLLCTLFHASLVLVPILGISWVLGFFVVNDSTVSQVFEWLFCIFTTLQGLMIFLMHCVLNREVRKAFLNAMGCREAAKKQQTMNSMRRAGVSYLRRRSSGALPSMEQLKNKTLQFTLSRKLARQCDDSTIPLEPGLALSSMGRRASVDPENCLPHINEEFEDDYSLPGTPQPKPHSLPRTMIT